MTRIAINGFGRIGRNSLRALLERDSDLEVVAINDLTAPDALAHLLKYDSALGRLGRPVTVEGDELVVDGRRIKVLGEREPAKLPWAELGVDIVLESTGRFTSADAARAHLDAGARRVLVSAPSAGADVTLAYGVNTEAYDPARHVIVSNASCTTNALAPLAAVLDDLAGIEHGFMTTVHAYTQEQNLQDGPHRDLRRARAAAVNIAPTTTGAAKAIGLVLPNLNGKLSGDSIRVPVPVGSLVELNTTVSREVSQEDVLAAYRAAADGRLKGILDYSDEPLVSSDITGEAASAIFDAALVRVDGTHAKVVAWYDNEWGFSNRVIDTLELLARD
jgi:glyceraldehyde 3-phosphate dehydrogenase